MSAFNIPNALSIFRIAVIPVMVLLFFIDAAAAAWINTLLFALAGASDYFDGVIARRTGQETLLGKFLDSSSDKMIVLSVLFMLVWNGTIAGIWVVLPIIIMLREVLISGVREFLGLHNVTMTVTRLAKYKLTVQMVAIGFFVPGEYGRDLIPVSLEIGKFLLVLATVFTVWSGWGYLTTGFNAIRNLDGRK